MTDLSSGDQGRVLQALTTDYAAGLPADVAAGLAIEGEVRFDIAKIIDYGDGSGAVVASVGDQVWRFLLIIQEGVWRVSLTVSLP